MNKKTYSLALFLTLFPFILYPCWSKRKKRSLKEEKIYEMVSEQVAVEDLKELYNIKVSGPFTNGDHKHTANGSGDMEIVIQEYSVQKEESRKYRKQKYCLVRCAIAINFMHLVAIYFNN